MHDFTGQKQSLYASTRTHTFSGNGVATRGGDNGALHRLQWTRCLLSVDTIADNGRIFVALAEHER